jgi:hypothetical protein
MWKAIPRDLSHIRDPVLSAPRLHAEGGDVRFRLRTLRAHRILRFV